MRGGGARRGTGSLVEIAITVVVIAVGVMGIFRLLSSSHREMAVSREYVAGAALAAEMIDRARLAPYERLEPTGGFVDAATLPWLAGLSDDGRLEGAERLASVTEGDGHRAVELEVRWPSRGKEASGAKGSCRFLILRTPFY